VKPRFLICPATIGAERRPEKRKLSKILISRLDVSNKIWLTMEIGRNAFHDGDADVASGMRLTTLLPARALLADFKRVGTWPSFCCWSRVIGAVGRFHIRFGEEAGRRIVAVLLAGTTFLLSACGDDGIISRFMLKADRIIVERRPDTVYEQLFPYYVELCATSQFRSKLKGEGGVAGHAAMYIKGACKDEEAPFPKLRRCRAAATELNDPEHGAGVSVGRWFRNVNWVAIPGYELFHDGNLKTGERLTQAHFEATVRDVISKGVYKGVEFHDYPGSGARAL